MGTEPIVIQWMETGARAMKVLVLTLLVTLHPLEKKGTNHLYNLEFQPAYETFEKLSREKPDSPMGPYYVALTLWMEELTRRGGMAGETFQSSRYWTRTRKQAPPPSLLRRFKTHTEEAIRRAKAILDSSAGDVDALYFLGATEGVASAFEATIRGRYFAAYRLGRRARKRHRQLMELHPSMAEAYLVPGIYEYAVATLPRSVRFLAFIMGIRGSKDKGAQYIRHAARGGTRTYWGARLSSVVVETREKRYAQALAYLRELESSFPKNPLFPLEKGWVYLLKKDWGAAQRVFAEVRRKHNLHVPHYARVPISIVLLRWGESYLFDGKFNEALQRFDSALAAPEVMETIRPMIHLRRGQAFDGLNKRPEARAEYQTTIRLNADKASRRNAKRYLKKPFRLSP